MSDAKKIAVVGGDGIGPEVIAEGLRVLSALTPEYELEHFDLGADRYLRDGTTMPAEIMERWRNEFDAIFLGALGDPRVPSNVHAKEILLGARFQLDLYINLRPIRLLDPSKCPLKDKGCDDVNFVVFRENTEGLYTGIGGQFKRGTLDEVAIEQEMNTRKGWSALFEPPLNMPIDTVTLRCAWQIKPTRCVTVTICGSGSTRWLQPSIQISNRSTCTLMC